MWSEKDSKMNIIAVTNTTPIISLCSVRCEFILKELFGNITLPTAVDVELRSLEKPGSRFSEEEWVRVVKVKNTDLVLFLEKDLDRGEAEAIALAKQLDADVVIVDENAGYQIAKLYSLPVIRTLSVLKIAKDKRIIREIRPIIEEMVERGRWYSPRVLDKFLGDVGEKV